jgi:hypothetical protein
MNAEIKARWLAALRSGKFKQGRYRLRKNDHYCCLGVLCEVVHEDVGGWWARPRENETSVWPCTQQAYVFKTEPGAGTVALLPKAVAEHAGLDPDQLGVSILPHWMLTDMNDQGNNFAEIADSIEKHL